MVVKKGGMKFSANQEQSEALAGYIAGLAEEISTDKHIGSVVGYVQSELSKEFGIAMDIAAYNAPRLFHHVYEWGAKFHDYSTVGMPNKRLWFLTQTGQGANRVVAYAFKPSRVPVPVNPELVDIGVKEGVHVFTWKAPVLEYGIRVTIKRLPGTKALAFIDKNGKLRFDKGPMKNRVGQDVNRGMFTKFFTTWWATEGPRIYRERLIPEIQSDVASPGRFAAAMRKYRTRNKQFTINTNYQGERTFASARARARKEIAQNAKQYRAEAAQRRLEMYGY